MAARLFIRLDLAPNGRVGPGKIALLEAIERTGSISAAGRASRMSYRRAWLLVEALNILFSRPVVTTQTGGTRGGGAALTALGLELVTTYRALEREAHTLAADRLAAIEAALPPDNPN
jgi:molybdate transport system regulatory protein